MKIAGYPVITLALLMLSSASYANNPEGISFRKDDWLLVCDNENTCRAAGYSPNDFENQNVVSVLLTRGNDNQPVTGEFIYKTDKTLTKPFILVINGKSYGKIPLSEDAVSLSTKQITAIVTMAKHQADIEFISGKYRFRLSDTGLAAVLLKMDDVQNRVGTSSALVAKGSKPYQPKSFTKQVLKQEADFLKTEPTIIKRNSVEGQRILDLLRPTVTDQATLENSKLYCPSVIDKTYQDPSNLDIEVLKLSDTKNLVITSCWTAAYNTGDGAWVMDQSLSKVEDSVSDIITDYDKRTLWSSQKGRGLGDCWRGAEWTWTGTNFVKTYAFETGLCRGFESGAWKLPTLFVATQAHPKLE